MSLQGVLQSIADYIYAKSFPCSHGKGTLQIGINGEVQDEINLLARGFVHTTAVREEDACRLESDKCLSNAFTHQDSLSATSSVTFARDTSSVEVDAPDASVA